MTNKGLFTISIDTELAWGSFDKGGLVKLDHGFKKYRSLINLLLDLFRKYDISATWAIVGHLFLDSCSRNGETIHDDIVRPNYSWFKKDWFAYDPATDLSRDPNWYGKDIVSMIKETSPEQEIGCHSFSHMVFSDPGCSIQAAESEIAKCVSLAKKHGINMESFIYPRNAIGHLDLLTKYGFKVYRSSERDKKIRHGNTSFLTKGYDLFLDMIPISPPVSNAVYEPETDIISVPASMLFRYSLGASKFIMPNIRYLKAKKGIQKAVDEKKIFHLWFHPVNFGWDTEMLISEFEKILKYASELRKQNKLDILPLREIAKNCEPMKKSSDKINPESIVLHDNRAPCFNKDYSSDLNDYCNSAFKFGRKKIVEDLTAVCSKIPKNSLVLDVGCGPGYFLKLLSEYGFNVFGVDRSTKMLAGLKKANNQAKVQLADARTLPFNDNTFDAVISIETLRYFDDRSTLLNELFRVLKPGGIAFISAAPLFASNFYGLFNSMCRIFKLRNFVSCFQSFETTVSLRKRLGKAGFSDISFTGHFFGPYFILDKISPALSSCLIKRFENIDDRLSKIKPLINFTNHLVAVIKKPTL